VSSDHVVPGAPWVVVRLQRPRAASARLPCLYFIHGGGYVVGSYTDDDQRLAGLAVALGCVTASVEYRLAPETSYPGPLDDCYAGLHWLHAHAGSLAIAPGPIGLMGASAGGGLAAALALLVRDRGAIPLAFQLLESPMLDDRRLTPSSRLDGLPIWSRESNEFGWRSYLGALNDSDDVPPYAAPARATDLRGLPPAFVIVGAVDGFRDEDVLYALELSRAGVPTELHVLPGAVHGVQKAFPATAVGRLWDRLTVDWLARHLRSR
jgi:acetyl esterase/lipase